MATNLVGEAPRVPIRKPSSYLNEFFGGLAAMLVALPSSIAFGVIVFSPLGSEYGAIGALTGIVGTACLGLVAPGIGGTNRLITAPCAPAAAVLGAFAAQYAAQGFEASLIVLLLALTALLCGLMQIGFGWLGLGKLIKYMPYPVVSGFLSGVGLVIIVNQIPIFLGGAKTVPFWTLLGSPALWRWDSMAIGSAAALLMIMAPRMLTKTVPAAILGLAGGWLVYFMAASHDPALLQLENNPLVVGPLIGGERGFLDSLALRWGGLPRLDASSVLSLLGPAATLAVLLSIDTLKTCVVLDAMTRSRHDPNRELIAQGWANLVSSLAGGMPGAGQMGATLVNLSSGGTTRLSGLLEGALALFAALLLSPLLAWVPISALAGILLVIGCRMIEWKSVNLLRSRATAPDFLVIAAVVVVAKSASLIAASGVGIGLAVLLFLREQIGGTVVRRKVFGNQIFSKHSRIPEAMGVLHDRGGELAVFELQGSLFFGTADQLYSALLPEAKSRPYLILEMHRVRSIDVSAVRTLKLISELMSERGGLMILCGLPKNLSIGRDVEDYFEKAGLLSSRANLRLFANLDVALEWVEDRTLEQSGLVEPAAATPLELKDIALFKGRKEDTLSDLARVMTQRFYPAGERIFASGDFGDELYLIRRGTVRIGLSTADGQTYHLTTIGAGDFFGEMAFLDPSQRSADAIAMTDTDLFVLTRAAFDSIANDHKKLAVGLLSALAAALALRLRYADSELKAAWEL